MLEYVSSEGLTQALLVETSYLKGLSCQGIPSKKGTCSETNLGSQTNLFLEPSYSSKKIEWF